MANSPILGTIGRHKAVGWMENLQLLLLLGTSSTSYWVSILHVGEFLPSNSNGLKLGNGFLSYLLPGLFLVFRLHFRFTKMVAKDYHRKRLQYYWSSLHNVEATVTRYPLFCCKYPTNCFTANNNNSIHRRNEWIM